METKTTRISKKRISKVNPNIFRLTIYFFNREKSNIFPTTITYKDVKTFQDAEVICNPKLSDIRKAFWNNKVIIENGKYLEN